MGLENPPRAAKQHEEVASRGNMAGADCNGNCRELWGYTGTAVMLSVFLHDTHGRTERHGWLCGRAVVRARLGCRTDCDSQLAKQIQDSVTSLA